MCTLDSIGLCYHSKFAHASFEYNFYVNGGTGFRYEMANAMNFHCIDSESNYIHFANFLKMVNGIAAIIAILIAFRSNFISEVDKTLTRFTYLLSNANQLI